MQVSQLASMTITRVRVLTTRIFTRFTGQLVAIPYVARNRKWLLLTRT